MFFGVADHRVEFREDSRMVLEQPSEEGETPVDEIGDDPGGTESSTGHVKPGIKPEGPPSKPKYYPVTDSE